MNVCIYAPFRKMNSTMIIGFINTCPCQSSHVGGQYNRSKNLIIGFSLLFEQYLFVILVVPIIPFKQSSFVEHVTPTIDFK